MTGDAVIFGGPSVENTQGYTPALWTNRRAIFFGNILSMFYGNEEETALLARRVQGAETYGGRLAPLLGFLFKGGRSVLVLERPPEAALWRYFADELKLTMPAVHVLGHDEYLALRHVLSDPGTEIPPLLRELASEPAAYLDGFVTDQTLEALAARLGKRTIASAAGSRRGNNKRLLQEHLEQARLPVFATRRAAGHADLPRCVDELAAEGYDKIAIKAPIGASGVGLITLHPGADTTVVPKFFFHEGPCLVQGWVRPGLHGVQEIKSPSVQVFLDEDTVYLYDLTEQILNEESVHQGNESPPPYLDTYPGLMEELFRQAGVAGSWLHRQGYRGTAGVDFVVTVLAGDRGWQVYVCEINARVTGATYPSVLARHYRPRGAWMMRNLGLVEPVAATTLLDLLRRHADLFHPGRASGVLPINFNTTSEGLVQRGQFLMLGDTREECREQLRRVEADLPLDWTYVTD